MLPIGPLDRPSAVLHSQISQGLQGIELNYLHTTFHRCLMQLATFDIEASRFSRTSRHDDRAIISWSGSPVARKRSPCRQWR